MNTTLTGSLTVAPPTATETSVPGGVSVAEFTTVRPFAAQTGLIVRTLASPGALVVLEGPGVTVTQVFFLYLRTSAPIEIEITQNGSPRLVEVNGLMILEADTLNPITGLRAKGSGVIEYFAAGPQ